MQSNSLEEAEEENDQKNEEQEEISLFPAVGHSDKPKVPIWRLVLLSCIAFSVNMGYGVESAYAIPLLVAAGLEITYASLTLTVSAFVGVLIHSYVGSVSDRCRCQWGRRRPFILFFSITMIIGFVVSPFSPLMSRLSITGAVLIGILMTGFGVMILDLSLGQIQLPFRAYLLDVVPTSQLQRGNYLMIMVAGIGGFCGFALGGVDWTKLFGLEENIVAEAQVFYMFAVLIVIVCLICTLFSVKEIPVSPHQVGEEIPSCKSCCYSCCSVNNFFYEFYTSILESGKFVFYLSKEMWVLWFAVFFGFISNFSVSIFFTTFVGEVVYGGDSSAPQYSDSYQLYTQGVRTGSWGLAGSAVVMIVSMMVFDLVTKYVGLKTIVLAVQYCTVIALFAMTLLTNVPAVLILVSFTGPFLGTILTFPFILINVYKKKSLLFRKQWSDCNADVVEGKACFVVNSAVFLAQSVAVLVTGPVIGLVGTSSAAITISCVSAAIALVFARFCSIPVDIK